MEQVSWFSSCYMVSPVVLGFLFRILPIQNLLKRAVRALVNRIKKLVTVLEVEEYGINADATKNSEPNQLFVATCLYLGDILKKKKEQQLQHRSSLLLVKQQLQDRRELGQIIDTWLTGRLPRVIKMDLPEYSAAEPVLKMSEGEWVEDDFQGKQLWWQLRENVMRGPLVDLIPSINAVEATCLHENKAPDTRKLWFELSVSKSTVRSPDDLRPYLRHILAAYKEIRASHRQRLLYTNIMASCNGWANRFHVWNNFHFQHPATFDTVAMDPSIKHRVVEDLTDFINTATYAEDNHCVKRAYLLYGPPGTGKSSLIAAIANFLEYDIYDLQLKDVRNNVHLINLLSKTSSKSVIVVEDMDSSLTTLRQSLKENYDTGNNNVDVNGDSDVQSSNDSAGADVDYESSDDTVDFDAESSNDESVADIDVEESNDVIVDSDAESSNDDIVADTDVEVSNDISIDADAKSSNDDSVDAEVQATSEYRCALKYTKIILKFINGLWSSSCCNQRIYIFTTNNPTAMLGSEDGYNFDLHINLSFCTFQVFKVLSNNYLGLQDHPLFQQVEMAMDRKGARMTPAEVCEIFTRNRQNPEKALQCIIKELQNKLSTVDHLS